MWFREYDNMLGSNVAGSDGGMEMVIRHKLYAAATSEQCD